MVISVNLNKVEKMAMKYPVYVRVRQEITKLLNISLAADVKRKDLMESLPIMGTFQIIICFEIVVHYSTRVNSNIFLQMKLTLAINAKYLIIFSKSPNCNCNELTIP